MREVWGSIHHTSIDFAAQTQGKYRINSFSHFHLKNDNDLQRGIYAIVVQKIEDDRLTFATQVCRPQFKHYSASSLL